MNETVKIIGDAGSLTIVITTLLSWLPHVAALLSVVWLGMRIYNEYLSIKIKKKGLK